MMQKVKVFTKGIRPFILLIATFVFAMFQGGFVSWFLFYTFLPFATVFDCPHFLSPYFY